MKKFITLALGLTLVFTLGACDIFEEEEEELAQGVTEDTVTVGNTAATSGAFADVGVPFNAALEAYFEMVNDEGGVAGREIEFVHYDDEFDGAQGQEYTERLVEEDEVFALVGHFGTPTVGATRDYLNQIGIPRVYYATGISELFAPEAEGGERSSFPVQPIYDAEGEVMVARAVDEYDAEKIGVIYSNADDGQGMLNGIEMRADDLGIELETQQVDPEGIDYSSQAATIVDADVDAVLVAANQVPAEIATKALYAEGNDAPVFTSYVNAEVSWLGNLEEDEIVSGEDFPLYASAWVDIFDETGEDFNEGYLQFAEQVEEYADNSFAMAGWIAAHFFVEGLERVGEDDLNWDNYIDAMEEDPIENPMGGIVDFADGSRVGTQAMALLKATAFEDEEGEIQVDWANHRMIEDISSILE